MTGYRRNFVAGGSLFHGQSGGSSASVVDRKYRCIAGSLPRDATASPFAIDAIVVLPDHLHSVWTLPEGDADLSTRWRLIKTSFSRKLAAGEPISSSRAGKGERGIWQRRYWEHTIRDEKDFERHIDYVHFNPVKHGLATRVRDWPYSSFHRMVRDGVYPEDWAGDVSGLDGEFGERR